MAGEKRGGTVLVVEDAADVRTLYAEWLTNAGFKVLEAANGAEGVAMAEFDSPVAIVMDLQMPEMDGYDATCHIRQALGSGPYLVIVSAHADDANRRKAYQAGADDVLGKPLAPDVLVAVISAALRARAT